MNIINSTPFRLKVVALAIASSASTGYAFNIDTGNRDLRISFDNTLKYSTAMRLKDQSDTLTSDDNYDDGNNNFNKGLVSNRLDLFSEFDASYDGFGVRVSGAAWYDDVYHRATDNTTSTNNNYGSASEFSDQTKDIMGGMLNSWMRLCMVVFLLSMAWKVRYA
ncbi:DUF1302 family protein [Marinomonas pontica]|nr:DUF1302 family protein [Marinomonas pontica]MCW8356419.1 DUF1302 family protein [Marinomonas pontica]